MLGTGQGVGHKDIYGKSVWAEGAASTNARRQA